MKATYLIQAGLPYFEIVYPFKRRRTVFDRETSNVIREKTERTMEVKTVLRPTDSTINIYLHKPEAIK